MRNLHFRFFITYLFLLFPLAGCTGFPEGTFGRNPWQTGSQQTEQVPAGTAQVTPTREESPSPARSINPFESLPPVNVALLLPLSGKHASVGQSMLQGAQLALFDLGYTHFQLMPRDTLGTPDGATRAATSAINDGAQLILGPLFADDVRAVKTIARSKNIPIISFSTDWNQADDNTFLMGFMPFSQAERTAHYALSKGYKTFGIIAPQDAYGNAVASHFSDTILKNGGQVIQSLRYNQADSNLITQIKNLKSNNSQSVPFEAVFLPIGGSDVDIISSALSLNGLTPDKMRRLGTGLWDDPQIIKQPNLQTGWMAAPSPQSRFSFEKRYTEIYGVAPVRLATLAYDATALAATLAKNGFEKNNKPAFHFSALTDSSGFAGTDGLFRFNKNGIIERKLSILEIRNGQLIEIDKANSRF